MSADAWWTCPGCGSDTETHEDPPPHRVCPDCGWTAALPVPRDVDEAEVKHAEY